MFFVVAISIVLIQHREWRRIQTLRAALAAYAISQLATVIIDAFVFPGALVTAVAGLLYPITFLLYTLFSNRVASVFQQHDWEMPEVSAP